MFVSDYHIHSNFSGDSNENLDKIVKKALELNLKEIAITDHEDYASPQQLEGFTLNHEIYFNTLQKLKEKYIKEIDIKKGIEIGIQPQIRDFSKKIIEIYKPDFVLCSMHTVDFMDVGTSEYFQGKTPNEAHKRYFESILESVKNYDAYSVFSHLDFITRYGGKDYRNLDLKVHMDTIEEILKTIISKGKGLEINSSGFRYGEDRFYPSEEILKKYFKYGGEIITIGSDSHKAQDLCKNFKEIYDFLDRNDIKYITSFNQMKPYFTKIK